MSLFLELLQLHGEAHVALDLELALHEGGLSVELSGHHVDEVVVVDGQGDVRLDAVVVADVEPHVAAAVLGVDEPDHFLAVRVLEKKVANFYRVPI